jgi:hypothetical protein
MGGVTNHMHDLVSGHISNYLFHWCNIYIHQQQGWEALNFAAKKYWFCCANRKGRRESKNRSVPLAQWLQRCMICMSGLSYKAIKKNVKAGVDFDVKAIDYSDDK